MAKVKIAKGISVDTDIIDSKLHGFDPVREETIQIDARTAGKMEEKMRWQGQRKLDERRVEEYARRMREKLWHRTVISIATIVDDDRNPVLDASGEQEAYIINGQHTLRAIVRTGSSLRMTILFYELTMTELEMLFSQIDDHKPRASVDMFGPLADKLSKEAEAKKGLIALPSSALEIIARGISWAENGFPIKLDKPQKDMLLYHLRYEWDFVHMIALRCGDKVFKNFNAVSASRFWKPQTVGVIYGLWKAGKKIDAFIRDLTCDRVREEGGHPIDVFVDFLRRPLADWEGLSVDDAAAYKEAKRKMAVITACAFLDAFKAFSDNDNKPCGYMVPLHAIRNAEDADLVRMLATCSDKNTGCDIVGADEIRESEDACIDTKTGSIEHHRLTQVGN